MMIKIWDIVSPVSKYGVREHRFPAIYVLTDDPTHQFLLDVFYSWWVNKDERETYSVNFEENFNLPKDALAKLCKGPLFARTEEAQERRVERDKRLCAGDWNFCFERKVVLFSTSQIQGNIDNDQREEVLWGGSLPSNTSIGCYTLIYIVDDQDTLCADCATEVLRGELSGEKLDWGPYDEGPVIHCEHCNKEITSSYGDPEEGEEETSDEDGNEDEDEDEYEDEEE
jgi:hypothetical protein